MNNISKLLARFVRPACEELLGSWHQENDRKAIEVVKNKKADCRHEAIESWLTKYRVFQGIRGEDRKRIVAQVLKYADGNRPSKLSEHRLLAEFSGLHASLQKVVKKKGGGKKRDLTSLTSKALWCCYPHDVPLYDSNVLRTLTVVSRLAGIKIKPRTKSRYGQFAEVWWPVYRQCLPLMQRRDLKDYQYNVRVFDKMLWLIGRPWE